MNDQDKTREQLIEELARLRERIADESALPELRTAAALFQVAPLGIHECDTEGRITFVNPSQEAITGFPADELVGTYVWDRLAPGPEKESLPAYFKHLVAEQSAPTPFFAKNIKKSGEVFDVRVDWNYIRNTQGDLTGFVCIVSDITDYKWAEAARRESEERFRRIFDEGPLGVVLASLDGGIEQVNRRFCDLLGYSEREIIDLGIEGVSHPDDCRVDAQLAARLLDGEIPFYTIDKRLLRKDGQVLWGQLTVSLLRNADGKVTHTIRMTEDITDRRQSEQALLESEERFRKVFEEGPLGFAMFGPDLRIQHVNKRVCDMLGYSEHELLELGVAGVTHPDDLEKDRQLVLRSLRGEIPYYTIDKRYVRKDGQVFWGQLAATMIFDAEGRPTHGIGMFGDITEQKRAEESVRQSEQKMRLHVERTPLAVIEWDLQLGVSKWNPGAKRVFGYTEEEALGRHFAFLVPPEVREHVDHLWADLRAKKGGERSTNENVTKDGRTILCEWYNTPLVNVEGQVVGFASLAEDITERKQMEAALRASEAKYRQLHRSMMDAFVSVSMDGQIQEFNDAYRQMLGYEPEELLALRYTDLTPEKWSPFEARIVQQQILPQGCSEVYEKEYRRKGGTVFPVELRTFLITDSEGKPAAMWAIVRDITERKQAEAALRQAHDKLEQKVKERTAELTTANELLKAEVEQRRQAEERLKREQEALRRMVLAIDHERRLITYDLHDGVAQQLLGAKMLLESQQPSKGRKPNETGDAYREGMDALRRATAEVRRVMNWLRTPVLDRFGLAEAIGDVASQLRSTPRAPEIDYRHDVKFNRLEPTLENSLFRIAQEAMTNACRHSQSENVRVILTQEGDEVTLVVQDWGIGFDQEAVVENRFGLEGIRERSRLLGGKLSVESEPGQGTVVRVTLPVIEAADEE